MLVTVALMSVGACLLEAQTGDIGGVPTATPVMPPMPTVVPITVVPITVAPITPAPTTVAPPVVTPPVSAAVGGPGKLLDELPEVHHCHVATKTCALDVCYPLPAKYPSYIRCVELGCSEKEKDCLEELVDALKAREKRDRK